MRNYLGAALHCALFNKRSTQKEQFGEWCGHGTTQSQNEGNIDHYGAYPEALKACERVHDSVQQKAECCFVSLLHCAAANAQIKSIQLFFG